MTDRAARKRLADCMESRRLDLRLTWGQVAERGGTTTETLRQARTGSTRIMPLTRRAIEDGLGWAKGSVRAVLDGGDPVPLDGHAALDPDEHAILTSRTLSEDQKVKLLKMLRALKDPGSPSPDQRKLG